MIIYKYNIILVYYEKEIDYVIKAWFAGAAQLLGYDRI